MSESETVESAAAGPASIKIPAWLGGYGVVGLVVLQALGFDPSQITGQGQTKQISEISGRVDDMDGRIGRAWAEVNAHRVNIHDLKSDSRILFERSTAGEAARSDIKATLKEMANALSLMAQSSVRVETKLDALLKSERQNR